MGITMGDIHPIIKDNTLPIIMAMGGNHHNDLLLLVDALHKVMANQDIHTQVIMDMAVFQPMVLAMADMVAFLQMILEMVQPDHHILDHTVMVAFLRRILGDLALRHHHHHHRVTTTHCLHLVVRNSI